MSALRRKKAYDDIDDDDDDGPPRSVSSEYFAGGRARRLGPRFYDRSCEELAKSLLGKVLVRRVPPDHGDGSVPLKVVRGRIVETECYAGVTDAASHSYRGRRTARNEPMYMKPGTAYVYMTYGMYYCFNISSAGDGAAVLLRSLEPLDDLDTMACLRKRSRKSTNTVMKKAELCNGPAKLCMSFAIDIESCNKQDLSTWDGMWVEEDKYSKSVGSIVCSPRIGIKCEKEWQDKFLRFYILDNGYISKLEKTKMSIIKYFNSENY